MISKQRINTPFSTISYNTETFLQTVLNELVLDGTLKFASYIKHKAEQDEEGKDHCHVYFEPNGALDPQKMLSERFLEFDPLKPDKPFACLPFRRAKTDDWILYGMHHEVYLWKKRQTREFHYKIEQFWATSDEYLRELYNNIDWRFMDDVVILQNVDNYSGIQELVQQGVINVHNAVGVKAMYSLVSRGYSKPHNPKTSNDGYYVDNDGVKDTRLKAENPPTIEF